MKMPLLCFFENFLLAAVDGPGPGPLTRRLRALRHWPSRQNRPTRH
jgi:hypothetical protein